MSVTERAAWLEDRRKGVGASDVAGILGLSPWASPYSIWASKVFEVVEDEDRDTLAMSFGRRAESMIAPWFTELTGLYVGGNQMTCRGDGDWERCTIDGYVFESPGDAEDCSRWSHKSVAIPLGPYEAKTTSATPAEWEENGIPVYYQTQGQWTMHVTGTDHIWFAVLHLAFGRPDLKVYELARDQADIDLIVKAVDTFWHDHVLTGIPPETDGHAATTYATKHLPASVGDMVEVPEGVAEIAKVLVATKAERKALDNYIDTYENAIRAALGDATEGYHNGALIVSHREQSRPEHLVKASTYRVLRAHKPKGE